MLVTFQIKVNELDFTTYSSLEDLRAVEKNLMYPPRFKISIIRLSHSHYKEFNTEFKISLENDGALVSDEVIKFPLIVKQIIRSDIKSILGTYMMAIQ